MLNFPRSSPALLVLRIFLLALAYVVAGRLSLLLAIPPGFVSGIFLSMGIALGAVLIWGSPMAIGVFLGSVLLNISISASPFISVQVVMVAVGIACASTLASLIGAALIRRFVGFPNSLTDEWRIFAFFTLGGPIATSVSASIGVLVLYLNDIIPIKHMLYSWWTWWIGDAIGVLIATPLVCVLFAEPRHFWRGRRLTVGVPLVVSSLIVIAVFVMSSNNEQKKLDDQFQQQARLVSGAVDSSLSSVTYTLATLRGLFAASEYVTREEFSSYIKYVIVEKQGVSGFSWNQRVLHDERDDYENRMRAESINSFHIKEKNSAGDFVVAPERGEYIAITYVEPWQENARILGFNVASDPVREEALVQARDTGAFAMTKPLQLLADDQQSPGVIVFYPVYSGMDMAKTLAERQRTLLGYATAIVRTGDLINSALKAFSTGDYHLTINDVTEPDKSYIFYQASEFQVPAYAQDLVLKQELFVGGRKLLVTVSPTEKFLTEHVSLQSWFVLAGGLLFSSLLGGFLLLISGRTQHITNLVEQRTKELAAILENAVESILVVDERGIIQKANPAAAQLFRYPLAQFASLHIADLVPVLHHKFMGQGEEFNAADLRECIGRCRDGGDVEIELSVSPVAIHERKFFTFIIHDATAKRKVDRLKSEFISTVSHELRTPLTSIKGALSIVTSGSLGELPQKVNDLLVIASNNADRLNRLVNDILDVDKLEFGNVVLSMKPSAIYPLLQASIEQNLGYAARYGVNLQLEPPADDSGVLVNLDSDRFLQVMANLLSNAIKFSYLDGVVRVKLEHEGKLIRVSVSDEGEGMAEDFRQRIFQKFAQVDSSDTRRRDGTGLGLNITKVIIERMGGKIDYHSVLGKGTTFYFELPVANWEAS
ncbi:MAG: CHASE domain-containing protein [Cellvibrio sp.]|uniref:CHASE domain-containing protein n=1 Tax=Cellvibrio sp. TaxID=1965322 RepID=UPI0031B20E8F